MKVTIEIDCTPDEARQFLGLPDVKSIQAAVMARIEAQMTEAANHFSPDALLRAWMPLVPPTTQPMSQAVAKLFRSSSHEHGKADE